VALPAVEIRPESGVYDYTARYTAGATRFLAPAELDQDVAERCAELAIGAHLALGLRDLSRTDLIVDATGVPVFLEANVAPGMTETSTMPLSMEAAGLDLGHVLSELVAVARRRGAGA
jgi:D-alanine-D-alanine ligase